MQRNLQKLGDFHVGKQFEGGIITDIKHRRGQLTAKITVQYAHNLRAFFTIKRINRFTWKAVI